MVGRVGLIGDSHTLHRMLLSVVDGTSGGGCAKSLRQNSEFLRSKLENGAYKYNLISVYIKFVHRS